MKKKKAKIKVKIKQTIQRTDSGQFVKGTSGCPGGRRKGSKNRYSIFEFWDAIKEVERDGRKPLLQHFIERAYEEDAVLIALMRKLLPDLKSIEGLIATFENSMTDELAKSIQNKLREQYEK